MRCLAFSFKLTSPDLILRLLSSPRAATISLHGSCSTEHHIQRWNKTVVRPDETTDTTLWNTVLPERNSQTVCPLGHAICLLVPANPVSPLTVAWFASSAILQQRHSSLVPSLASLFRLCGNPLFRYLFALLLTNLSIGAHFLHQFYFEYTVISQKGLQLPQHKVGNSPTAFPFYNLFASSAHSSALQRTQPAISVPLMR